MRERFTVTSYNYGKTAYRNMYEAVHTNAVQGAKAKKVLVEHRKVAPKVLMRPTHFVDCEETSDVDGEIETKTWQELREYGVAEAAIGAVDITEWIHTKINNDRPSCKVSFICSMAEQSGLLSAEELEMLIKHKEGYVMQTDEGRKIVQKYHRLGSVLERKMQGDAEVSQIVHDRWLRGVVEDVRSGRYEAAEEKYMECIGWLSKRYGQKEWE